MKVTSAAAVFQVSDLPRAIAFFEDVLGFEQEFIYGEPPMYGALQRDEISIHLSAANSPDKVAKLGRGSAYVFCDEVDNYYDQVVQRGAVVTLPLAAKPYGMRDFQVKDPDGNLVGFGKPLG